jgi:hypothetical protein
MSSSPCIHNDFLIRIEAQLGFKGKHLSARQTGLMLGVRQHPARIEVKPEVFNGCAEVSCSNSCCKHIKDQQLFLKHADNPSQLELFI